MKFSTEAISKMAEIMVSAMQQNGLEGEGVCAVEMGMREFLREVGVQALGRYLEQKDEEIQEDEKMCVCGEAMNYLFQRKGTILSIFGRVSYRRRYHVCEECHAGVSSLDRHMRIEAGQVTAGLAELLALAGVEISFEEGTRWLERYLLFRVSDNTLRKETERFGELQKDQEAEWIKNSQNEKWLQQRQRELGKQPGRLYGSLDGGHLHLRAVQVWRPWSASGASSRTSPGIEWSRSALTTPALAGGARENGGGTPSE